jgi:hypothetical protein
MQFRQERLGLGGQNSMPCGGDRASWQRATHWGRQLPMRGQRAPPDSRAVTVGPIWFERLPCLGGCRTLLSVWIATISRTQCPS